MIDRNKKEVKRLIQDNQFIMWCLSPTEKENLKWQAWMDERPERPEIVEEARKVILSVRLNDYKMPHEDQELLYYRISDSLQKRNKKRYFRINIYRYAAACVLVALCSVMTLKLLYRDREQGDIKETLFTQDQIEKTQTEVELKVGHERSMLLENKATVKLNSKGEIRVDSKVTEQGLDDKKEPDKKPSGKEVMEKLNTLKVPYGRRSSLVLADGTKVWVNSGSVVLFPSTFDKDKRVIYVEGEAYLEVAKETERPFMVKTPKMDVRVLGTSFNVSAYEDDAEQSVVLRTGHVRIDNGSGIQRDIQPNEMLVMKDDLMSVAKVNANDYISWVNGEFLFKSKKIGYIAQRLMRYYGVTIKTSPAVDELMCSGKLVLFDDIHQVMQTLCDGLPITYRTEGDLVILEHKKNKGNN